MQGNQGNQCIHLSGEENVTIDPLTLFLRLLVVVERKPENEIAKCHSLKIDRCVPQRNLHLKPFC